MDPFTALSQAYQSSLSPWLSPAQLQRITQEIPQKVAKLNALVDWQERLAVVKEIITLLSDTKIDAQTSTPLPDHFPQGASLLPPIWTQSLLNTPTALTLDQWLESLIAQLESWYQMLVRSEPFAQTLVQYWEHALKEPPATDSTLNPEQRAAPVNCPTDLIPTPRSSKSIKAKTTAVHKSRKTSKAKGSANGHSKMAEA